jgi:hypothetical protein
MKTVIIGLVVCLYGSFNAVAQEPLNTKNLVVKPERLNHSRVQTTTPKKGGNSNKKKITTTRKIEALPAKRLETK